MANRKSLTAILGCVFLLGCIPSIYPLYSDEDLVFDQNLAGTWKQEGENNVWTVRPKGEQSYTVVLLEGNRASVFEGHLLEISSQLYFDLYPEELELAGGFYAGHFVPAHTFYRVTALGDRLILKGLDYDLVEKQREDGLLNLTTFLADGDCIVLAAETPQLQEFVTNHSDLFKHEVQLVRQTD